MRPSIYLFFFFFNDTATTEIYTLSLHDALPILNGADGYFGLFHPRMNDCAELRHFYKSRFGNTVRRNVSANRFQPFENSRVVVLKPSDSSHDFGKIPRLHGNSRRLENLFAITHRVERRGPRTDRTDPEFLEALHHAAHGLEPVQVVAKLRRIRR